MLLICFSLFRPLHHLNSMSLLLSFSRLDIHIRNIIGFFFEFCFVILQFWLKHFPSPLFNLSLALQPRVNVYFVFLILFSLPGAVSSCYHSVYIIIRQLNHYVFTPPLTAPIPSFRVLDVLHLWIAIHFFPFI